MNRTLEGLAAIFQSWFVDFDPVRWNMQRQDAKTPGRKADKPKPPLASSPPGGFALNPKLAALFPNAFESSELGEIPQGWRRCEHLDIADLLTGDSKTVGARLLGWSDPLGVAKDVSQCGETF